MKKTQIIAVIPAAGVGARMQADIPKQYLMLQNKTILEHTVEKLLNQPEVDHIVIAISDGDAYYADLAIANHPRVHVASGGKERADSVLSALNTILNSPNYSKTEQNTWALVHDAARPLVNNQDISLLIQTCLHNQYGGILAAPVKDTMKQATTVNGSVTINKTIDRSELWHALTPQLFPCELLCNAIEQAMKHNIAVTDEASAIEYIGEKVALVEGSAENIKITRPVDLKLAAFLMQDE
ncbi:2-C-methyl-D-erythritol 4-phosphate cytidylyltransferase [Flocculibacter collagenilyticus]|uniref:2-C-methyl-D-erythritol 4-phosphate cytidylyltransferase n=1 Tax=Flocculibacter collagenilyticus TaxID=2744479 RepID=UPI0018F29215|nr:2-C-methyl-D-erythritol 4-phosphate cytidylyltransferase [Flocculibacter collagenilyticus]